MAGYDGVADDHGDRLTVPLGFDVPEGWRLTDPVAAGAPAAVLVLVHDAAGADYTPNVTVGVERRTDRIDIADAANEALGRLTAAVRDVEVLHRAGWGAPDAAMTGTSATGAAPLSTTAPGAAQMIRFTAPGLSGAQVSLVQSQVHLAMALGDAPGDELLVELACTCAADRIHEVAPGFERFVAGLRVRDGDGDAHDGGRH